MKTKNFDVTLNVALGSILRSLCMLTSALSGTATVAVTIVMAVMLNAVLGLNQSNLPWFISLSLNTLILASCALVVVFAAIARWIVTEIDHVYDRKIAKTASCRSCFFYSVIASPMVALGISGIFIGNVKDTLWLAEQHFGMLFIYTPVACVLLLLALWLLWTATNKYYCTK